MMPTQATVELDDAAAMAVRADALAAAGHPRGELIHLQLALEARPGDRRLTAVVREHLARHDRVLLGGLRTSTSLCQLTWRRGYVVEASLRSLMQPGEGHRLPAPRKARVVRVVRELVRHESARLTLERLELAMPWSVAAREQLAWAVTEAAGARPPSLRTVVVQILEQDGWGWPVAFTRPAAAALVEHVAGPVRYLVSESMLEAVRRMVD